MSEVQPRAAGGGRRPSRPRWVPAPPVEDRLAVLVAGPTWEPGVDAAVRDLVRGEIDGTGLARRALLGQIGPLVLAGAERLGIAADLPAVAIVELRRQHDANIVRTRRIDRVLDAILTRLDAEAIPVMAHKGVALAAAVYEDPSLRIMGDIDLCVPDADRARAESAVASVCRDLVRVHPDRRSPNGLRVELDGTSHHDVRPELHGAGRWRAGELDWDGIWRRAVPALFGRHRLLVPCPTDLVVTLAANGLRRGFSPVRLVVDLAHAVARLRDAIDWDALRGELVRTGMDRRAWYAFLLAREWCGVEVPAIVARPPPQLRAAIYERSILEWKRRRPFSRVPTRLLWAGSWTGAAVAAVDLAGGVARRRARRGGRTARDSARQARRGGRSGEDSARQARGRISA